MNLDFFLLLLSIFLGVASWYISTLVILALFWIACFILIVRVLFKLIVRVLKSSNKV